MPAQHDQSPGSKVPISFEIGTDEACFDSLRDSWECLEQACGSRSLFMSWHWQRLWWEHYGAARHLRLFIARHESGQLLGILPMYLEPGRLGPFPIRRLRNVGSGGDTAPDDLDPLLHPQFADVVARGFARQILDARAQWDEAVCSDLDPDAPFSRAFAEAAGTTRAVLLRCASRSIVCADLPNRWDDYLEQLGAHRRKGLRRKLRKFESEDGSAVVWHRGAAQVDEAFDRLAGLHRLRWQARSSSHAFASETYLSFHRRLMHWLDEQGALRLLELRARGQGFAMRYGYRWRDTFYDLQTGFDPSFADLSPGELGLALAVEHAIGEGCTRFDLLRGDYEHKRGLFKQERRSEDLHAYHGLRTICLVRARSVAARGRRHLAALWARLHALGQSPQGGPAGS